MAAIIDDVFDPLEDLDADEEILTVIGAAPTLDGIGAPLKAGGAAVDGPDDDVPAAQRISELLAAMPGLKGVLLGIIEHCSEPRDAASVDAVTAELTKHQYSIYSPVTLRELLEQAGALEYLSAPEEDHEPLIVNESLSDGVNEYELQFMEIEQSPEGFWLATSEGLAYIDANDAGGQLASLLEADKGLADIHQSILSFCAAPGGRNIKEIDALIADDPRLIKPRKYGGYFVERLEACGALTWKGRWATSDLGLSAIESVERDDGI
jgi:hypothetical protein